MTEQRGHVYKMQNLQTNNLISIQTNKVMNKNKTDPLRAMSIFMRKEMGHTAVLAT